MRFPKNYVGRNHETLGSDILAVLKVTTMPEVVLGEELTQRLRGLSAERWYPISLMLEATERIYQQVGRSGLLSMGRSLFRLTHQKAFLASASSAGDFFYSFDSIYREANRGEGIGGWKIVEFKPGLAVMECTTPHHCEMEEGIMMEALAALQLPVIVTQTACVKNGADACLFRVTSIVKDDRWAGKHALI